MNFVNRAWLGNQVELMEWVLTNGTFDKDSKEILSQDDMLRRLVERGHLPMLKWWFEKYGASDIILNKRQFTKAAAAQGELEVLKWLVEKGFKYSADCLAAAAQGGELECIEYLREIGCPWSNKVAKIDMAAGAALWLPKPGHFRHVLYYPVAAEKYVQVLRYLMETGCPWDAPYVLMAVGRVTSIQTLERDAVMLKRRRMVSTRTTSAPTSNGSDSEPNSNSPTTSSRRRKKAKKRRRAE